MQTGVRSVKCTNNSVRRESPFPNKTFESIDVTCEGFANIRIRQSLEFPYPLHQRCYHVFLLSLKGACFLAPFKEGNKQGLARLPVQLADLGNFPVYPSIGKVANHVDKQSKIAKAASRYLVMDAPSEKKILV